MPNSINFYERIFYMFFLVTVWFHVSCIQITFFHLVCFRRNNVHSLITLPLLSHGWIIEIYFFLFLFLFIKIIAFIFCVSIGQWENVTRNSQFWYKKQIDTGGNETNSKLFQFKFAIFTCCNWQLALPKDFIGTVA